MDQIHPTTEQLAAFAAGDLTGTEAQSIRHALESSPKLKAAELRLRQIITTMQTDDTQAASAFVIERAVMAFAEQARRPAEASPQMSLLEKVRQVIATLVFDSRAQPALAGFRGTSAGYQLSYETEGGDIDLQVTQSKDANLWKLTGQVALENKNLKGDVTAMFADTGRLAESANIDEHGRFRLTVPTGSYELHVSLVDRVIVLPELDTG